MEPTFTCSKCRLDYTGPCEVTRLGNPICYPCATEHYTKCDDCTCFTRNHELVERAGHMVCPTCAILYYICTRCDEYVLRSSTTYTNIGRMCDSCYDDTAECEGCGDRYSYDSLLDGRCEGCSDGADKFYCNGQRSSIHGGMHPLFPIDRLLGLELEFIADTSYEPPNVSMWGDTKPDGSLSYTSGREAGVEFASRPLSGDKFVEMVQAVTTACSPHDVNDSCGMHLHIDMYGYSALQRSNIVTWWKATEPLWFCLVDPDRLNNEFCRPIRALSSLRHEEGRYYALNISAYHKHGTFELRLHHGTLDKNEILTFCSAALCFFDAVKDKDICDFPYTPDYATFPAASVEAFDSLINNAHISESILKALKAYTMES